MKNLRYLINLFIISLLTLHGQLEAHGTIKTQHKPLAPILSQLSLLSTGKIQTDKEAQLTKFPEPTEWTVLVFVEGRNNLNNFAKKNIQEIGRAHV